MCLDYEIFSFRSAPRPPRQFFLLLLLFRFLLTVSFSYLFCFVLFVHFFGLYHGDSRVGLGSVGFGWLVGWLVTVNLMIVRT